MRFFPLKYIRVEPYPSDIGRVCAQGQQKAHKFTTHQSRKRRTGINDTSTKVMDSFGAAVRKKLVIVGDGACGKTSLLMYPSPHTLSLQRIPKRKANWALRRVFQRGDFPEEHVPTVFDTYVQDVRFGPSNTAVQLALWDTAGQEDFDRLRPLCYADSDIVLICFSLDNYDSLENVVEKWQPEVLQYTGHLRVPYILVGTKRDLRGPRGTGVSYLEGEAIARRIGARGYIECSARYNEGVLEVFQFAAKEACRPRQKPGRLGRTGNNCTIL